MQGKIKSDRHHNHTVYCAQCDATAEVSDYGNQATVGKYFGHLGWKKVGRPQQWTCPTCIAKRKRGRPPGIPNPGTGRPPIGDKARTSHTITIAPDLLPLVQGHAKARGQSLSESINMLLHEALNP